MKKDEAFVLGKISDKLYALPVGQRLAEHKKALRLNSGSEFLIQLFKEEVDMEGILNAFAKKYNFTEAELLQEKNDIVNMVAYLEDYGVINYENSVMAVNVDRQSKFFHYGNVYVSISGDEVYIDEKLKVFKIKACPDNCDKSLQKVCLFKGEPYNKLNGKVLLRNEEIVIMENDNRYILLFLQQPEIFEMHISKNGEKVYVYIDENADINKTKEAVFCALRFAYLIIARNNNIYVLHSASIEYENRAWLFSASSGTGKSTHANLWKNNLNTPILNGDLNAVGFVGDELYVYGIPWCGTSEIYSVEKKLLGGVIFLKQNNDNYVEELSDEKKILKLMLRTISPLWTKEMLEQFLHYAEKFAKLSNMVLLHCTKEDAALWVIKEKIDNFCH